MKLYIISSVILFVGTICGLKVSNNKKPLYSFALILVSSTIGMIPALESVIRGCTTETLLFSFSPVGDIIVRIDPLSAFFLLITYLGAIFTSLYSIDYLKEYQNKNQFVLLYLSFNFLILSMVLLLTMQNIFAFLMVWEVMSLTSFLAIMFEGGKEDVRRAGLEYFVYMHIGFLFILTGFLLLSNMAGDLNMLSFRDSLNNKSMKAMVAFLLLFFGFGIKAGFAPFHNWLPKAHPASVSNISGFMSGIMLKMGIFGILRFSLMLETPSKVIIFAVLSISSVTALIGILYAMFENDIKKLLAYSSIENMGIIGIGIGLMLAGNAYKNPMMTVLGFSGALLHSLNHSIFKPLLFFSSGNIYLKTHTRNINRLGGLLKLMPYSSYMFIIGSAAISGLPLLSGFISEFMIYFGAVEGVRTSVMPLAVISVCAMTVIAFVGVMAVVCFTKASGIMLLGSARSSFAHDIKDDMKVSLVSMILMSTLILLTGLFPQLAFNLLSQVIHSSFPEEHSLVLIYFKRILTNISFSSLLFLLIFSVVFMLRRLMLKGRIGRAERVWDCGYVRGTPEVQYKSSSYTEPLRNISSMLLNERGTKTEIEEYFPKKMSVEKEKQDVFEKYLIAPSMGFLKRFFDRFSGIQKGSTQQYLLMGLLFLLISLLILIIKQ
ncbi:MAG: proton-conducting transporter membrane subunit [bacterium]